MDTFNERDSAGMTIQLVSQRVVERFGVGGWLFQHRFRRFMGVLPSCRCVLGEGKGYLRNIGDQGIDIAPVLQC